MRITLEHYGIKCTTECPDESTADEINDIFSRLLVQAGFPPSVINDLEGGRWEYLGEDEIIVKKEDK